MTLRRVLLVIAFLVATGAWIAVVYWLTGMDRKEAAYLDIDLAEIPTGSPKFYTFQRTPLALVRTTDAMLNDLEGQTAHTWNHRPIAAGRPSFFIYSLVSPADGCEVEHVPKGARTATRQCARGKAAITIHAVLANGTTLAARSSSTRTRTRGCCRWPTWMFQTSKSGNTTFCGSRVLRSDSRDQCFARAKEIRPPAALSTLVATEGV